MKKLFTILAILFCLSSSASHIYGVDWAYKSTATPGVYAVKLTMYRECSAVSLCSPVCDTVCRVSVSIRSGDSLLNYGVNNRMLTLSKRPVSIVPECGTVLSSCSNMNCVPPSERGTYHNSIEAYEFTGMIDLRNIPSSFCNISVSYDECCRDNEIKTSNAAGAVFYSECMINRCISSNSSPELRTPPAFTACNGLIFSHNPGAYDPDGDSLSYEFAPVMLGYNTPAAYNPPFSYNRPLPWTGSPDNFYPNGIYCDPVSGDIHFKPGGAPSFPFVSIMVISIKQWRLDETSGTYTLAGITRRETRMSLSDCGTNNIPSLVAMPKPGTLPPGKDWSVYEGEQLCFDIIADDNDLIPGGRDTTWLSWDSTLAAYGATFKPAYDPEPARTRQADHYTFCWTPAPGTARSRPYYFSVTGKDSRCPVPGKVNRSFAVQVLESFNVSIIKQDKKCERWQLTYINNAPQQKIGNVLWKIAKEPDDLTFRYGSNVVSTSDTTPVLSFDRPGKYIVILQLAANTNNEYQAFYDTIVVGEKLRSIVRDTAACKETFIRIDPSSKNGTAPFSYQWYNYEGDTAASINNSASGVSHIIVAPLHTRSYALKTTDLYGCTSWQTMTFTVLPLPSGFASSIMSVCKGEKAFISPENNMDSTKYLWSTGDTTKSIEADKAGWYKVNMLHSSGCRYTDSVYLYVNAIPVVKASQDTAVCSGAWVGLSANGADYYTWYSSETGTLIGSTDTVSVTPRQSSYYIVIGRTVYFTGASCMNKDTVSVSISPSPAAITISGNTTPSLLTSYLYSVPFTAGSTYHWSITGGTQISGSNTSSIQVMWNSPGSLSVRETNSTGCPGPLASITIKTITGISEADENNYTIYPNPADSWVEVSSPVNMTEIRLMDISGRLLPVDITMSDTGRNHIYRLDLSSYPRGLYIISVSEKSGISYYKIAKR